MIASLYLPFRNWSERGTVWLYSDPHFDDEDCRIMNPAWPEPEDQLKNIQKCVGKHDTLIVLGDVGNKEYFRKVKGHKVLICGNHDSGPNVYTDVFDEVYGGPLVISKKIILSHEPMNLSCMLNIHGHIHNGVYLEKDYYGRTTGLNVAADVINWTPVSLNSIIKSGILVDIKNIHREYLDKMLPSSTK